MKSKKGAKAAKEHPNKKSLAGQQAVQKNKTQARLSKEDLIVETPSMDIITGMFNPFIHFQIGATTAKFPP